MAISKKLYSHNIGSDVSVKWTGDELMKRYRATIKIDSDIFSQLDNAVKSHGARLRKGTLGIDGNRLTGEFTIIAESEEAIRKCTAAIRTIPSVIELTGLCLTDASMVPSKKMKEDFVFLTPETIKN